MTTSAVDPFAEEVLADPFPTLKELRDAGPAVQLTSHGLWALTRYDEIRAALRDWTTYTSARGTAMTDEMNAPMLGSVLASDPPEHTALRSVLSEKLAPRALAGLRDDIASRADLLVAEVVARGSFDAVSDLVAPLPVDLVSDLVGLGPDGREKLLPGADAMFASFGPMDQRMQAKLPQFMDYLEWMFSFDASALTPGSWGAAIFDAAAAGRIREESALPLLTAYLVAGMDTTVAALAAYVGHLAADPALFAELKADPSLVGAGFEETLRLDCPIIVSFRNTTRDVDLTGTTIPAGARVALFNASGNRDERHYADPDRFDLHRGSVDHLTFGYATHACAGQGLARLEARGLVEALLRRVERIELAGEPVLRPHTTLRSLERLPVRVVAAAS